MELKNKYKYNTHLDSVIYDTGIVRTPEAHLSVRQQLITSQNILVAADNQVTTFFSHCH
jgi:hypothetical protein